MANDPRERWKNLDHIELMDVTGTSFREAPRDTRRRFYFGKAHTARGERWWECGAVEDRDGYLLYCLRFWRWHRGPHRFLEGLNRNVTPPQ